MALRDWQPWQIGALWVVGLVLMGVLLRRNLSAFSGEGASGGMASFSVPILPGLAALLVLVALVAATVWWARRAA
jgi:hypothetical protein